MILKKLPVISKGVAYLVLLVVMIGLWRVGIEIGAIGLGVVGGLLLLMDWNDWRLKRFFSYDFFLYRKEMKSFADKEVKKELIEVLSLIDEIRGLLHELEKKGLLKLAKDAPIFQKEDLNKLYFEMEEKVEQVNEFFWKYSGGADLKTEKGKMIYFIYSSSFIALYDVGSRLSEASNFVVYLLSIESSTFKNLLRSLIFPSTQVFLKSALYVLDGLSFRSKKVGELKKNFVGDIKRSVGVSQFPFWSSLKYYFSLVGLFKQQRLVPVLKSFLLFIDKRRIREGGMAMNEKDVEKVVNVLEPGDIILVRRALTMTSVVIPGYWTHAALYVGSREQVSEFFGIDSKSVLKLMDDLRLGDSKYVLEAVEKGVTATEYMKGLKSDSIVVFKPKIGEFDRLDALEYALLNMEKEYDYGLDFLSEGSFICSELVYKAYSDLKTGEQKLGFVAKSKAGLVFTFTPEDIYESCVKGLGDRFELGICLKHNKNYSKVKEVKKLKV